MVIITLFVAFPVIWSLVVSFKNVNIFSLRSHSLLSIPGRFVGLKNYIAVFHDTLFLHSLWNTIYFSLTFIPATLILSLIIAVQLNRGVRAVSYLRSLFFIPYVLPVVSISIVFLFLFQGKQGIFNGMLQLIHLQGPNWLASTRWAMPVIAIMSTWRRLGYFMLIYLAGLQNIPKEIYEAADMDGATTWTRFWHVTWPMLKPVTFIVIILLIIDVFNVFQEIYIMTGGGPSNSTTTVPFLIYNEAFQYYQVGPAAAMSYVLFLAAIVVSTVQFAFLRRQR